MSRLMPATVLGIRPDVVSGPLDWPTPDFENALLFHQASEISLLWLVACCTCDTAV